MERSLTGAVFAAGFEGDASVFAGVACFGAAACGVGAGGSNVQTPPAQDGSDAAGVVIW